LNIRLKYKLCRLAVWVIFLILASSLFIQANAGTTGNLLLAKLSSDADTSTESWHITTAKFFTTPLMTTVLLTIALLGFLIELITLCSVAGGVGILSMIIFFASHIIMDPARWWVSIIFIVGFIFLFAEIFLLPGHGASGIIGLICTYLSIFLVAPPAQAAVSMLISVFIAGGIFAVLLKYLPKSSTWNKFRLISEQTNEEGYVSSKKRVELEGALGTAVTDLRPSGIASIDDERVDVTTGGGYIKKDSPVRVVKVEGIRIVVEEVETGW